MPRPALSPLLAVSLAGNVALAAVVFAGADDDGVVNVCVDVAGAGEDEFAVDVDADCACSVVDACPVRPRRPGAPADPADAPPLADPLRLPDGPLVDGVPAPGNDDIFDQPLQRTERRPVPIEPRRRQRPVVAYHPEPCLGSSCMDFDPDFAARVGVDVGAGYATGGLDGVELPLHVSASLGFKDGVRVAAHTLTSLSTSVGPRGGVFVGPQLSFDVLDVARVEAGIAVGLAHSGGGEGGVIEPALLVPMSAAFHVADDTDLVIGLLGGRYPTAELHRTPAVVSGERCDPTVLAGKPGEWTPGLWGAATIGLATEFDLD
jgi:hypothetical protein